MSTAEFKLLFSGPMGAGKTTAINAISDQKVVSTDVANTDLGEFNKATTTAALDYGYIDLGTGNGVRLYGTPGQERFRFMWPILANNAAGIIILLNGDHPQLIEHLDLYVEAFWQGGNLPMLIGIGRLTAAEESEVLMHVMEHLERKHYSAPVVAVDVRQKEDVLMMVDTLLCLVEANDIGAVPL